MGEPTGRASSFKPGLRVGVLNQRTRLRLRLAFRPISLTPNLSEDAMSSSVLGDPAVSTFPRWMAEAEFPRRKSSAR